MITSDQKNIRRFERELGRMSKRAFPFAIRNTLNDAAFGGQRGYKQNIRMEMTNRNPWTERSARVRTVRDREIRRMKSVVGSAEEYLDFQERGGTRRGRGKHGIPIPTSYSAGQEGALPRTSLVRRANRMQNIRLSQDYQSSGINRMQRFVRTVQVAVQTGRRVVFLEHPGTGDPGIYKIVGGRRKFSRGWPPGAKIKLLHSLKNKVTYTERNPMLEPAAKQQRMLMPRYYERRLEQQIARERLFRDKRGG